MKNKKTLITLLVVLMVCAMALTACAATQLTAPVITLDGNKVTWTAVDGANGYNVTIDSDQPIKVTETSYTVNKTAVGSYKITVVALGDGGKTLDSAPSNQVTYVVEPHTLAAPVVTLQGNVASWQAVPNAVGYVAKLDNGEYKAVDGLSYTFTGESLAVGAHTLTVVAKGNGTDILDSSASDAVTFTKEFKEIKLATAGVKTTYYLDEGLSQVDLTNLVVKAVYNDGTEVVVDHDDLSVSAHDLSTVGDKTVTISYNVDTVTESKSLFVTVAKRSLEDIDTYATLDVVYDATAQNKYLLDGYTAVRGMDGQSLLDADGKANLPMGQTLVATNDGFVLVTVAYHVSSVEQYKTIMDDPDGYYVLTKDLDFENAWMNDFTIGVAPVLDGTIDLNGVGSQYSSEDENPGNNDNLGVAFTGTFDGRGYTVKNFKLGREVKWHGNAIGLAMFGYLGEGATVCNLNLRGFNVSAGSYSALLVGYNQGTVCNISIEANNYLYSEYGGGAVVVGCNYGTVTNVVSNIATMADRNGAKVYPLACKMDGADIVADNSLTEQTGCYSATTENLTETLGEGWMYVEGFGTVVSNADIVYIATADRDLVINGKLYLDTVFANGNAVNVSFYGNAPKNDELTFGWDAEAGSHYVQIADLSTSTIVVGEQYTVVFHSTNWKSSYSIVVTITNPVTGYQAVATTTVEKLQGQDLSDNEVALTKNFAYGDSTTVAPVKVEGYNKLTLGEQSVKLFYGEGAEDFVTITVNVLENPNDVAQSLAVTTTNDTLAYGKDDTLTTLLAGDATSYQITMTSGLTHDVLASDVTISVQAGRVSGLLTVTYAYSGEYGSVSATKDYTIWYKVTDKADWAVMQSDLAGYYRLTNHVNFDATAIEPLATQQVYNHASAGTSCNPANKDASGWAVTNDNAKQFVGIFDGCGYSLHNFKVSGGDWTYTGFGLSLFGHVGANGIVKNFTISNATYKSNNDTAFVATVNEGTIQNVVVDSNCTIHANYGTSGIITYNVGTATNLISYVAKVQGNNEVNLKAIHTNTGTATNCDVVGSETFGSITAEVLNGALTTEGEKAWVMVDNHGAVYGKYIVIIPQAESAPIGGTLSVKIYTNDSVTGAYTWVGNQGEVSCENKGENTYELTISSDTFTQTGSASIGIRFASFGYYFITIEVTQSL